MEKIKNAIEKRYKNVSVISIEREGEIVKVRCTMGRNVTRYIAHYIFNNCEGVRAVHFWHPTEEYVQRAIIDFGKKKKKGKTYLGGKRWSELSEHDKGVVADLEI